MAVSAGHELSAPTLLRSQTLSALHERVHAGQLGGLSALEGPSGNAMTPDTSRLLPSTPKLGRNEGHTGTTMS